MISRPVTVAGSADAQAKLAKAATGLTGAFIGAVYVAAADVVTRAMRKTPVDTGYLRESRYVTKPEAASGSFAVEVGFSAPYASFVHDIPRAHRVGEDHFLDKAFAEVTGGDLPSRITKDTWKFFEQGVTIDRMPALQPVAPMVGQPLNAIGRGRARKAASLRERGGLRHARAKDAIRRASSRGRVE